MVLAGVIAGNILNIYISRKVLSGDILEDYKSCFLKDASYYLIQFFMVAMYMLIYKKAADINELVRFCLYSAFMFAVVIEDFNEKKISNKLIVAFAIIGLITDMFMHTTNALIGIIIMVLLVGGVFGIIYRTSRGGIGAGDVKLLACSALFLGPGELFTTIIIAVLFTFLTGIVLVAMRRMEKKSLVPFSPFVLAGFLFSIL